MSATRLALERAPWLFAFAVRGARAFLGRLGVLGWMERPRETDRLLFLRTMLAFHDAADMARLDLPWWTVRASRRVDAFLRGRSGSAVAFEYGSGASTLWLARRCKTVYSVEHDPAWAARIEALAHGFNNVHLIHRAPEPVARDAAFESQFPGWGRTGFEAYVRAIDSAPGPFDLIAIDGRCRSQCLRAALGKLAAGGLIVLDNSNRRRYRAAIEASGLHTARLRGWAPAIPYLEETMLLARTPPLSSAANPRHTGSRSSSST
ncbi:MAG TPA: class I SAM-dependent methyltransferase [Alphaproteobacteria bacterium]|nr:class I SAM-dependent methyltransferase [Alphaproteobacteria bacterium]